MYQSKHNKALVGIIGCPNVGKSSLFNMVIGRRKSIVTDVEGTTRDRVLSEVNWQGNYYWLMDTAGMAAEETEVLKTPIEKQIKMGLEEADLLLLLIDGEKGLTIKDRAIFKNLRPMSDRIILVINKVDRERQDYDLSDFYQLGIDDIFTISSKNGRGVAELLDRVATRLTELGFSLKEEESNPKLLKMCVFGRPNVGKSSLVNALVGNERMVVSEIPGTTRDPGEVFLKFGGQELLLFDTAGVTMRNQKKRENMKYYSTVRSIKALQYSDVAVVLIDAVEGLTKRDLSIISLIEETGKGIVLFVNKWDLVDDEEEQQKFLDKLRYKLKFIYWAGVVFGSAKEETNLKPLMKLVIKTGESFKRVIDKSLFPQMLIDLENSIPKINGLAIRYVKQVRTAPPTFIAKVKNIKRINQNDERALENAIREYWQFTGVPIKILWR